MISSRISVTLCDSLGFKSAIYISTIPSNHGLESAIAWRYLNTFRIN
jgi:hypothetical protein